MTVVAVGMFGFTPGQFALGIRVAPLGRPQRWSACGRCRAPLLTFLIVPPLLRTRDGRGLHDRLCRTVVVTPR